MQIGFIGLGNMATAILRGLRGSAAHAGAEICGYDAAPAALAQAETAYAVQPAPSAADVAVFSDVVVLAVKPQVLPEVLTELAGMLAGKLVITIAAGKDLAFYRDKLGKTAIVRVMPNINAKVGAACSALCATPEVTPQQMELARSVFATVGDVLEIPETQFPAFSALSGAGVAFVYLFIDALARAGVRAGFSKAAATEIAASTVLGSAKLVQESGEHPMALVDQVCSPAGTTIEGIQALQRLGFEAAVHEAVAAVIRRDLEIRNGK